MSEQFVLRWHYQELTLLKNLTTFLENDVLTDVTISVESHTVKAHKLVLAMCSVYFFQLFQEMRDTQHPVIVLHNVALSDIKAVLAFIYRGQCVVSKEQLPGLLSLAKLLKIQGLCDMKVPEKPQLNDISSEKRPNSTDNAHKTESSEKATEHFAETFLKNNDEEDDSYSLPSKKHAKDLSETCKCFLCGKYLSNQYNLRVHMETHEEAYHACQSCPHVSRSRDALRKHVSYRHPEEYHTRKRKKIT
ncbi:longitudinals lacking protein, isoforms H/M/V [Tribolium castaneum]|uniref:Protein bric-a-brac 1-like Protein n=1 Tax=Tribolium castaneum TaxID=7070 RepID=D6WWM3_TRICA|nr:PREDICTED: longitudinals lacking protein, isoforms H/M/V [Tribolium castaneum]EFA08735.1 Protein bric-a-brac 1-like Protein [Tribolium castaneum]|eukprot:XP_974993.1 PREDICTED: longitudinals lacking protein, isoforms H/M/V [Tribolium castaneum]